MTPTEPSALESLLHGLIAAVQVHIDGAAELDLAKLVTSLQRARAMASTQRPEGGSPWNAAIDAAIRIAERAWVEENSLTGSKVAKKIAESIRDLRTEPQRDGS